MNSRSLSAFLAWALCVLCVRPSPAAAQETVLLGLAFDSPTVIHVAAGERTRVGYLGACAAWTSWSEVRGVREHNALFAPRDPAAPAERFVVTLRPGSVVVVSAQAVRPAGSGLSPVVCESKGLIFRPADLDQDCEVTVADWNVALNRYAGGCWDFDCSGACDVVDLLAYASCF